MIPFHLPEIFIDVFQRLEELERRVENRERTGKVVEVDHEKGLARVELGKTKDGQPFKSPWVPWEMPAMGDCKINVPPSVGQQVKVCSESGDLTDAVIRSALRSDENPLPVVKPGEGTIVSGSTSIFWNKDKTLIKTPHYRVESGKVEFVKSGGKSKPGAPIS